MHAKLLSRFAQEFDAALGGTLGPLQHTVEALQRGPAGAEVAGQANALRNLRQRLVTLGEKVANQQSYVLIFGPLKSGKSTLMNALAGAWVSEISCLPAYPCLVFVQHGEKRRFQVISYDGHTQNVTDTKELAKSLEAAHEKLAERIRKAEGGDSEYDPQTHGVDAIRRIDVHVPAKDLQQSGAVLVDTPGLYSRMKFGYGQMTRDFRNAAACAVFVVKSDNLFLEQVFAEFEELLDLFSRIFLVVNVDSTKRDLDPTGSPVPSVEQTKPERVVRAFENLAMSDALCRARDAGRLRIHPVDLMKAASSRLRGDADPPADFAQFHGELTEFLASPDYLASFVTDSLRRAWLLLGETEQNLRDEPAVRLQQRADQIAAEREELQQVSAALERVGAHDWLAAYAGYQEKLRTAVSARGHEAGTKVQRLMDGALDQWFLSSASLGGLLEQEWRPTWSALRGELTTVARDLLDRNLLEPDGGADPSESLGRDLQSLDIDLGRLRTQAAHQLLDEPLPRMPSIDIDASEIPLRRGAADWAMLRSVDKVRQTVFGDPALGEDPRIPSRSKASRLGEPAKRYMRELLAHHHRTHTPQVIQDVVHRYGAEVAERTHKALKEELEQRKTRIDQRRQQLEQMWNEAMQMLTPLRKVAEAVTQSKAKVKALAERHGANTATRAEPAVEIPTAPAPASGRRRSASPGSRNRRR